MDLLTGGDEDEEINTKKQKKVDLTINMKIRMIKNKTFLFAG